MQITLTKHARRAVSTAWKEAAGQGHAEPAHDHLLLGLCREKEGGAVETLGALGVPADRVIAEIERRAAQLAGVEPGTLARLLTEAGEEARRLGQSEAGTEHLLFALLKAGEGVAATVLQGIKKDS